jgi:hypothetical protein
MASATDKRIKALMEAIAAKIEIPPTIRHAVINDGDPVPAEAEGEILIVRVIVSPPDRPEDPALPPRPDPPAPPIERGDRTRIDVQDPDPVRFRRRIEYPKQGFA